MNAPQGVAPEAIDAALAALRGTGYADVANQPTRLTISTNSVRYYNAEDAAAAAEIAALVAPFLPGGTAEARDFTDAPSRAASGRLEIWVAGAAPAASRSAPSRPPAPVIDAAAIQRLVERVRAEPALENAGRGAADAARGFEAGAERFARQVDAAVGGALRALEGQP